MTTPPDTDAWNEPEELQPLDIQSPPMWADYDKYLLNGGQLEYSEWMLQAKVEKRITGGAHAC